MIRITPVIAIEESSIEFEFVRSSGPGGQNVNKVATAVKLRFDVRGAQGLPEYVRQRLIVLAGKRLTTGGILIIDARRFRTQERNRQDAIERLCDMIRQAAERPKARVKTKPSQAARERRLGSKHSRGQSKTLRRPVAPADD
ncbi:MAG: alternative ribosome rescue aminoacyl-tRNA hydrolase ArfB [Syntrophaceae bacterium]